MNSNDAPGPDAAGASQPRPSSDAQQQGPAQSTPFTFTLVHRLKPNDSDISAPNDFETEHTDATGAPSPTKETTAPAISPPQKHITPTTTAITVASILRNSHSRYSQEQFDEESVHGDGDDQSRDDHHGDDSNFGFALDVDLEHDYVLARGGSSSSSSNRPTNGNKYKTNCLSGRTKRHIPVKGGGAFTRKVQYRRIGTGGRSGSGMSGGIGRAAGGAPLAADGFDFDLSGMPVVPYTAGIDSSHLQRAQQCNHHRFAHQQRIQKGRPNALRRPAGRLHRRVASLFSSNNEPHAESPALHYVTTHGVWTSLQALPGFSFAPNVAFLFQERPGARDNSNDQHDFIRLLSTILTDPAIVCKCDKSTCRGRNSGLPQFLVVLFALAPTLHVWPQPSEVQASRSPQPLPWNASDTTGMDFEVGDGEERMAEIGADEIGDMVMDMDMQDTATSDVERYLTGVAAPIFPARPELASASDTLFWAWLANTLFEQYANSDNSGEDGDDDTEHARGLVDRTRPSWITDAYAAPGVGHKVYALMELLVDARRRFLAEEAQRKSNESNESNDMEDDSAGTDLDAWSLVADMPARLAGERGQTHPCRWGTPLTCKDPICYQGDLATPMSCCDLHDLRVGLAVDLWSLWLDQGRHALGQSNANTELTQPPQQTHKALIEWARRLESRVPAHNTAVEEWQQKQEAR